MTTDVQATWSEAWRVCPECRPKGVREAKDGRKMVLVLHGLNPPCTDLALAAAVRWLHGSCEWVGVEHPVSDTVVIEYRLTLTEDMGARCVDAPTLDAAVAAAIVAVVKEQGDEQ